MSWKYGAYKSLCTYNEIAIILLNIMYVRTNTHVYQKDILGTCKSEWKVNANVCIRLTPRLIYDSIY